MSAADDKSRKGSTESGTQRRQKKKRQHAPVYRRIFSNPRMIEEVLSRFVHGPWIDKLDFSTLELVPPTTPAPFSSPAKATSSGEYATVPGRTSGSSSTC